MNTWNLTPRESEVLEAMADAGNGNAKVIAQKLGCSDRTIEIHVHSAMKKMQAATRLHAVLLWDRQNRRAA